MKIPNKRELQQIVLNHLSNIEFKYFIKLYKGYNKEPFSFLVNNTTLPSDNLLRFTKKLLQITVKKTQKNNQKQNRAK